MALDPTAEPNADFVVFAVVDTLDFILCLYPPSTAESKNHFSPARCEKILPAIQQRDATH
jgi:hypothetical protein